MPCPYEVGLRFDRPASLSGSPAGIARVWRPSKVGSVFKRCFKDKKTGRTKRIRTFSIKYPDENGRWRTEPTDTTSKTLALRILAEKELGLANPPATREPGVPQAGLPTTR